MLGIIGYGVYIPPYRIKIKDLAKANHKNPQNIISSLQLFEKSVGGPDEDSVTFAVSSAQNAIQMARLKAADINALFAGSESPPYAVNPSSTIIASILGIKNNYFSADLQFACKAGTASAQIISSLINTSKINYGLAIGTDKAQAKPADALEYTAASASASLLIAKNNKKVLAKIIDYLSFSTDTPDFWRRDCQKYPSHAGRFTGKPAYFNCIINATKKILAKNKLKPAHFDYLVFHMPNSKFPQQAAKALGFSKSQLSPSLVVSQIGNSYSASSLVGLSNVFDIAKPDALILLTSYGSGAGADSFILKTTKNIKKAQKWQKKNKKRVSDYINRKQYINYPTYLKFMQII